MDFDALFDEAIGDGTNFIPEGEESTESQPVSGDESETDEVDGADEGAVDDDSVDDEDPVDDDGDDPDSDEDDEVEDDDSEGDDDSERIVVEDGQVVVVDGEELSAEDIRNGILRQADYTRKTQELAEQRKEFEAERELLTEEVEQVRSFVQALDENPSEVLARTAQLYGGTEVLAGALAATQDPSLTFLAVAAHLIKSRALDPDLVEQLGLNSTQLDRVIREAAREDELARYRQEAEARANESSAASKGSEKESVEAGKSREDRHLELVQEWKQLRVSNSAFKFANADEERAVFVEVAQIALERDISIEDAFDKWELAKLREARRRSGETSRKRASAKKAGKAVSRGSAATKSVVPPKKIESFSDLDTVMESTLSDLLG